MKVVAITAVIGLGMLAACRAARADDPTPDRWTKSLSDRTQRGELHDSFQRVRGDCGKWSDEAKLLHAAPIQQKPDSVSLDDWMDLSSEQNFRPSSNDDNWLLFRTGQLDDNDRVWVERIERSGNRITVVVNEAVWQGRYQKNFTYYGVIGINVGALEAGRYEVKYVVRPYRFRKFDEPGQTRENWPIEEEPSDQHARELSIAFTVRAASHQ